MELNFSIDGGDWTANYDLLSSYGHIYQSNGGSICAVFTGTVFRISAYVGKGYGKMYVSIDGGEEVEINLNAAESERKVVFTSHVYENKAHIVKIRGVGKINVESFCFIS